jgi:phosphoglycolate phosphatase
VKPARAVLLDVDGTLVDCAGAGRRAIEQAVRDHCGLPDGPLAALRMDGSTDRLIVREALALLSRPFSEDACDAVLARHVAGLAAALDDAAFRVLPGVVEALDALRAQGVAYGLCTGNVAEAARLKLRRGGLDSYFEWTPQAIAGFASDGEARERIVAAALDRARARLGDLAPSQALVVGDTPRDVEAAHRVGCPVLTVATGRYGVDALRACGADHVVETLAEPVALRLLLG